MAEQHCQLSPLHNLKEVLLEEAQIAQILAKKHGLLGTQAHRKCSGSLVILSHTSTTFEAFAATQFQ